MVSEIETQNRTSDPPPADTSSSHAAQDSAGSNVSAKQFTVGSLDRPETTKPIKILWPYVIGIGGVHLMLPLVFVPWLFSWSGVALAVLGLYAFGTLGINLCYHRLLTHQGFVCPKWLEHTFATLGVCCLEDTPARWVSVHRLHHKHSDTEPDPHSPLVKLIWGHMGWLLVENRELSQVATYEKYARDVLRDPFYMRFERNLFWMWVYAAHAALFYLVGFGVGWAATGQLMGGVQLGLSWFIWGVIVRTVAVWHITWSVNSLTHIWGYQNYDTGENSRNNWFVALVSNGEGWHNNHHADQRAASHGHRWWEFDVTYLTIKFMRLVGLAKDVVPPKCWTKGPTAV